MAGLGEERGGGGGETGLERTGGVWEGRGAQTRLPSMMDGGCLRGKKAVDGGMAAVQRNKRRGRLNKKIHHWGKGIRLIEGPVKERDNLRGVKVKIW